MKNHSGTEGVQKKENAEDLTPREIEGDAVAREVAGSEADDKCTEGSPPLNRKFDRRSESKDSESSQSTGKFWESF